jgi:hypothetical protein
MVIDVNKENKKPTIIGVVGLIGAGKDTVADYLVNIHQFRRESFANSLKDAVAHVFNWERELLEGRTKQSREWREQPDPWWSTRLGQAITPRWVLQYWGTEVCRKAFHDDIWIASLENKIRNSRDDIVISDCRFPNEIKAIKDAGGIVIRVVRGPEPVWFELARIVNQGPKNNIEWRMSKNELEKHNVHASETAWIGTEFDAMIDNNEEGFNALYTQINDLLLNLQPATEDLHV